jgi:hypothetical protein
MMITIVLDYKRLRGFVVLCFYLIHVMDSLNGFWFNIPLGVLDADLSYLFIPV